jgi:hypothetical protein
MTAAATRNTAAVADPAVDIGRKPGGLLSNIAIRWRSVALSRIR